MSIQPTAVALSKGQKVCETVTRHVKRMLAAAAASAVVVLVGASTLAAPPAEARMVTHQLSIPAQDLGEALRTLSAVADEQVLFSEQVVQGKKSGGVEGSFTTDQALDLLLKGSGLKAERTPSGVVLIREPGAVAPAGKPSGKKESKEARKGGGFWSSFRVAEAAASESAVKEDSDQAGRLEEIVVTAQKREERLQDVPMSIAVISGQDIERRGVVGMQDYLRSIPGVNQIDRGGRDNAITIRGISTSPEFENLGSGWTVATYFDETPITGAAGANSGGVDLRPVDLERIEVLRGPQGTSYGSGSLGGTMRMIPVRPKLNDLSAKMSASYSDTSDYGSGNSMLQGVVNIPVAEDKIALRLVGYRYDESGYYRNVAGENPVAIAFAENFGLGDFVRGYLQDDVGRMVSTGGRLSGLWKANEKLTVNLNVLTQTTEQDGQPLANIGTGYDQSLQPIAPQVRVRGESGEVNDTSMDLLNAVVNYDLGWADLTSTVSWIDSDTPASFASTTPRLGPSSVSYKTKFDSISAETRLASRLGGRSEFLGGLFYESVNDDWIQHSGDWPGSAATNPFGTDPMLFVDGSRDLTQRAIFGEFSYAITSKLSGTVGGRYFRYEKKNSSLLEGGLLGVPLGSGIAQVIRGSADDSIFKASLSYKPTDEATLYASWGQGFRLGPPDSAGLPPALCDTNGDGIIDGTNTSIESTKHVDSDFLDNHEIGAKLSLFDRRLMIDTSVYYVEWQGLPIRTLAGGTSCPASSYTANVGAATSRGMDLQSSLFIAQGLRVDFGIGYTKAELSKDAPALAGSPRKGARLPGSPKVNANLAAQYDFEVLGRKAFVRADSFYTGEFYGDLLQTPGLKAGEYIKIDARIGVDWTDSLRLELYGRNLTNQDDFTWRGLGGANSGAGNPSFGYRLRPRTVGIQISYDFE